MKNLVTILGIAAALAVFGTAGCSAYDRAAGTDSSGIYPQQQNGSLANPSGTAGTRALDRAAGTDLSGAYPDQQDGTSGNPSGSRFGRAYDRVTGDSVSGAYPQNVRPGRGSY